MSPAEFLLARTAEDEEAARNLLWWAQDTDLKLQDPKYLGLDQPGWHSWPDVEKMCQHVLAECEAKRRIVDAAPWANNGGHAALKDLPGRWILRLLALPYADHPDYDPAWKP